MLLLFGQGPFSRPSEDFWSKHRSVWPDLPSCVCGVSWVSAIQVESSKEDIPFGRIFLAPTSLHGAVLSITCDAEGLGWLLFDTFG